ncbi:DNA repair protein RadC [Novosphingobium sp. CF614]|nr:DNA repair protein RadC [Novosphingobium sp. CF614]
MLFDGTGDLCGHLARCDGGPRSISARYRLLFEHAFTLDASGFVLVHNHPSGIPWPSARDVASTRALAAMARATELEFLDHVVVGGRSAVSMRRAGLML